MARDETTALSDIDSLVDCAGPARNNGAPLAAVVRWWSPAISTHVLHLGMSDSAPRLVYMTTANRDEAQRLGAMLVKERLAACVNILDGMTSMFWWENAVQSDYETVLIAKTRADLVPRLTERVKATHSYECPCVVSLALDGGNPEFLAWIQTETESAEE